MLEKLVVKHIHAKPPPAPKPKRHRVPKVAAFGRLLTRLRERRFGTRSNAEQVARYLRDNEGVTTTGGSLRGYELGWNPSFDPVVLAGLAKVYKIGLVALISVLAANREDSSLSDTQVEHILRQGRSREEAEAASARRFAEIGERLRTIGAELAGYGSEAFEHATGARTDHRLGEQAPTDGEPAPGPDPGRE